MSEPKVFLAAPHYGEVSAAMSASVITASKQTFPLLNFNPASLLAHNFNRLFCTALNERQEQGFTHFAMLHADVAPDPGWLDVLLAEMQRVGADILSAIVPIKDTRGLTSTGWYDPDKDDLTRFTMREVMRLPQTFDAAGAGKPGKYLMINTGCWICDFTKPWVEEFPGFQILDAIKKNAEGKSVAHVFPEDWNFSRWAAKKGLKVFATRAVKLSHYGNFAFRNDSAWGEWDTDYGDCPDPAENIHGWMKRGELQWLRKQAAQAKFVLEIGCWHGRSTFALAQSCPGFVLAVDHFQGAPGDKESELADATQSGPQARQAFHENLKPFLNSNKVILWEMPSAHAIHKIKTWYPTGPDFIFVDGAHDYESVKEDIRGCKKILAPGGLLSGHDIDRPGVRKAVDEECPGWQKAAGSIWTWRTK